MRLRLYFVLSLFVLMGNTGCPRASDFMRLYGYTEIRPPSKLLSAGTMVLISRKDPFEAKVICDAYDSLGDVELSESQTASGMLKSMQGKSSSLDVSIMGMLQQNSRYRAVQSIDVTLENVKVIEVTDANILESMRNRSRSCSYAVDQRVKQGFTVTMISSTLLADVRYTIRWSKEAQENMSQQDKLGVAQELSATLSGEVHEVSDAAIFAKGLIWGIRDDEYLSALSQPNINEAEFERNTRQIAPEKIIIVPPEASP